MAAAHYTICKGKCKQESRHLEKEVFLIFLCYWAAERKHINTIWEQHFLSLIFYNNVFLSHYFQYLIQTLNTWNKRSTIATIIYTCVGLKFLINGKSHWEYNRLKPEHFVPNVAFKSFHTLIHISMKNNNVSSKKTKNKQQQEQQKKVV